MSKGFEPLGSFGIGAALFLIWKKPEFSLEAMETHPYAIDGSIPMIFIQIAWFELIFEWPWLYKILYKRKNGYLPYHFDQEG